MNPQFFNAMTPCVADEGWTAVGTVILVVVVVMARRVRRIEIHL